MVINFDVSSGEQAHTLQQMKINSEQMLSPGLDNSSSNNNYRTFFMT